MKLLILILHLILFLFYQVTGTVYETALKTFQFYKYIQFNYMKVKKKKQNQNKTTTNRTLLSIFAYMKTIPDFRLLSLDRERDLE